MKTNFIKITVIFCSVALISCATVVDKEMQAAGAVIATEVQSAENVICKLIPMGTWRVMYGSSPERAAGWAALCNPAVTALKGSAP